MLLAAASLGLLTWRVTAGALGPAVLPAHADIYEQAHVEFSRAAFFKPVERDPADLLFQLAPLILQEIGQTNRFRLLDQPGTPILSKDVLEVDSTRPAVFVESDTVRLNGRPHARISYSWFYPPAVIQGVRLTLSAAGEPVIWEVLTRSAGQQLIFVSESLESAAKAQFGPPLPGRRYSIECDPADALNIVVARVLADSGVAMGPMVYLRTGTHEVATVACRCMPVQTKAIAVSRDYFLVPVNNDDVSSALLLAEQQNQRRMTYWPGQEIGNPGVAKCLRLPRDF